MNNTAVINIKTNPKIKKEAQAVASDLGLSLSAVINAYLHQLGKKKVEPFVGKKKVEPFVDRLPYLCEGQ
jgi:antitoxin component of RelBE/YafQ-DinJ toxin-antitoxin module